jgi:hypothetical protein
VTRSSSTKRSSRRISRAPQAAQGKTVGGTATMEPSGTSESKAKRNQSKAPSLPESEGYDSWLDQRLKSLYQPMLEAPLPADMLKLLRSRKPS